MFYFEIYDKISVDLYESITIVHICQKIHHVCTYDITLIYYIIYA